MAIAITPCKECDGSGRNGTIGGYAVLCLPCRGLGWTSKPVAGQDSAPFFLFMPPPE